MQHIKVHVTQTAAGSLRRRPVISEACARSVGGDFTPAALLQRSNPLDFGEGGNARIGDALAVDRAAGVGVARGGRGSAGLLEARVDPRFERGAALGGGHVDIAVSDLDGHDLLGRGRGGERDEGEQGESETHVTNSERMREGFGICDAVFRHSVAIRNSGAVHKSDVQMRNARNWFQRLQPDSDGFPGTT